MEEGKLAQGGEEESTVAQGEEESTVLETIIKKRYTKPTNQIPNNKRVLEHLYTLNSDRN